MEKWLIRLKDCKNDNLIAAYYTDNPKAQLETFYFMKEHDMDLGITENLDDENYKYKNKEAGHINDIVVCFGGYGSYSYIDVWLEDIY